MANLLKMLNNLVNYRSQKQNENTETRQEQEGRGYQTKANTWQLYGGTNHPPVQDRTTARQRDAIRSLAKCGSLCIAIRQGGHDVGLDSQFLVKMWGWL